MACADADLLAALVAGALSEDERAEIAHHAAACALCHELVSGLVEPTPSEHGAGPGDATADGRGPAGELLRLPVGSRVGRYVIEERIGVGGMGVVYAALDSELERRVAVKLLRPDGDGERATQGRERLMREARTLASLSHDNVVTVFDVGTHDGHLFLAMELVEGGNLGAWLRVERRGTAEIVDRLLEAGRGLAAAHAAGVVHRDVKPDNILVGRDGRARVTDFGLARTDPGAGPDTTAPAARDLTRTGTLMGTPAYMAPEQWQRAATGPATDQWAYCATLYEAVAGVRPFAVGDAAARTAQVAEGRLAAPAPGRVVPPWLRAIVARGLRTDPAERWPSMDAVVAALARGRNRRRRVTRTIAVASGVAIAAVAIAVPLVVRGGAPPAQDRRLALQGWVDQRPGGCNCPFSTCIDGRCLSECDAENFSLGAPVPDINLPGRQEILSGASPDGETILYLAGDGCAADHLYLARRRGARFESIDLTAQLAAMGLTVYEGCCGLAPDGSLIITTADRVGFVRARIDGATVVAPDTRELADLIPAPVAQRRVHYPVLSADQRTIYYRVDAPVDAFGDAGPYDGIHAAVRTDPGVPFAPGRLLPGFARHYETVSGVSADGLTLFMAAEFRTPVMFRASASEPFASIHHTVPPTRLPGWRAIPLDGCERLLTTGTPGGCHQEDIIYLDAVRR